jgi:hypothetical protein
VQNPKASVVEFVGADSSFTIVFRRTSPVSVRVWSCGDITEAADGAILNAVLDAVQALLSGGNRLGEADIARADLDAAIRSATDAGGRFK